MQGMQIDVLPSELTKHSEELPLVIEHLVARVEATKKTQSLPLAPVCADGSCGPES